MTWQSQQAFCSSLLPLELTQNIFCPNALHGGRRGLRLRRGEFGKRALVLVVEHEEPLQEIVYDALKEGDFDPTTVASR